MQTVKAKKFLGQHFLKDLDIAQKIADSLQGVGYDLVLEIGPGMGVLTQYLLAKSHDTQVVEIDRESVAYLTKNFPQLEGKIHGSDFLKMNLKEVFGGKSMAIIGNFPYNISSQIVFKEYVANSTSKTSVLDFKATSKLLAHGANHTNN